MDENNMGNNNSIENNNDANGFVMVDNPAPQASQEPQEPQTENQNQNQPVQPEPEAASQYIQPEPEATPQYTQPEPEVTPQYTQPEPEQAQQQNTNYEQPVQPSPMPSEDNTYRFQNVEAQNVKKKKEKKAKKGMSIPKILVSAVLFGVIAAGCFFGVNKGLSDLFGTKSEIQGVDNSSNNGVALTTVSGSAATVADVSGIVEKVMPSIVAITEKSTQTSYFGQTYSSEGAGSGFIVKQDNDQLLIVTNNHVVADADKISVTFNDNEVADAMVKGTSESNDLAVITVKLSSLKESTKKSIRVASLGNSDQAKVGQMVIAIGNALGYGQSVTTGIVSALDRNLDMEGFDSKLIQTDAAINPGNSGGALLNANGELIGINTAKVNANAVEGMGYAIPISDATSVIENLMNRETRTKVDESEQGFLGIEGYDVTSEKAEMYSIPTGVFVRSVEDGSAADKAGITAECIITKFDGITIDSMSTLQSQMQYFKAGDKVEVVIEVPNKSGTKYEEKTVTVTLGERSK